MLLLYHYYKYLVSSNHVVIVSEICWEECDVFYIYSIAHM